MRETTKGRDCREGRERERERGRGSGWDPLGLPLHGPPRLSQLCKDSEEEDDDEDAAECPPKHRVQRLTREAASPGPPGRLR